VSDDSHSRRKDANARLKREMKIVGVVFIFAFVLIVFACYVAWRNGTASPFFNVEGVSSGNM